MNRSNSKAIIFSVVFIDLLGFGIMIPMLPFYARSFGASATEVGLLMFVYSFVQFFLAPYWGRLSDRFGRRPILLITIAGQAVSFFMAALAPSYFLLLISRLFAGGFAANISTANAYMADITPPEDRARGMGLIGAAFGLGFIFGPAIGGLLIPYGYEWPSFAAAFLSAINLIWAFVKLDEPLVDSVIRKTNRRKFDLYSVGRILSSPAHFTPIFLFFLLTLAFVQLEITFGLFILDQFGFTERSAGLLLAFLGIIMAVVQGVFIGKLTKRFGEPKLILFGSVLIIAGLMSLSFGAHLVFLVAALFMLAVGYSLTNPCLTASVSKASSPSEQGSVLGIFQSGGSLARILGPITAGALYDMSRHYPFLSGGFIVIIALIIWLVHIIRWRPV